MIVNNINSSATATVPNGGVWIYVSTKIYSVISSYNSYLKYVHCQNLYSVTSIGTYAFQNCSSLALTSLPSGITNIGSYAFYKCTSLASIKFLGIPNTISSTVFIECTNLIDIYVPWSEGAVANAPWGAINATIHYNWSDDNAS